MTIPQAFQLALQHHQAGRLADAEALYRQILAVQPNHADALHLLGLIAHQTGHHDLAIDLIRKAIVLDPNYAAAHSNLGQAYSAKGLLDEAMAAYRRATQIKPGFPEAYNNLGDALRIRGRFDESMVACRRALELKPDFPEALNNLGAACAEQGQFDEAIANFRRALELKSDYPEALNNLGGALVDQGKFDEAISTCRQALRLKPNHPGAHNNLGAALAGQRRFAEAIAAYRSALELKPDYAAAHNNLGNALRERGQLEDAIIACRRAVQLKPDYTEGLNNLGNALKDRGDLDEASRAYRQALEFKPDYTAAHINLGAALAGQGRLDEAIAAYRRALELKPDHPEALNNLSAAFRDLVQLDEAVASSRRALALKPDYAEAYNNLGNALRARGELDEAVASYRRALELKPEHAGMRSNLVFTLHFLPAHDESAISKEHHRWNRHFSDPPKQLVLPNANGRNLERPLRIGYVSPDFRDHPVGRFVLPLFEHHSRERFEILCYSGVAWGDWMTERLRASAAKWRTTVGVSDEHLSEMIREDEVDILVDLAMHTAGNRLPVFAMQPAPVQVAWLAYPGSTGLRSIGYRLTDARMDPPGEESAWSAEEPVRLPDSWCCYQPADESPEIQALPALSGHGLTFGSLNNFAKVNDSVMALWARVLEAVKDSRLLMFCPDGRARERIRTFFDARGIAPECLELVGFVPRREYLKHYQRTDIALDTFPFNGMTTTCDALWMGVPVLTLPGAMPVSRAGLSLLSNAGLGELAARSEDDYVRIAADLAGNLPRLAELRTTLRKRMQASPLMDAPRFARNVEAAYRSMWRSMAHRAILHPRIK